jgi:hypothetical protein
MKKLRKIYTLNDARNDRAISEARAATPGTKENRQMRADVAAMLADADARVLAANPQIGKLMRNGKPVYYVTAPEYREAARPFELVGGAA